MNKQLATWQFIHKSLSKQIPVLLLYVLESKGSSPGRRGFFMGVNAAGDMEGSIGGGIMEHKLVEMAKDKLEKDEQVHSLRRQIHDKSAARNQSGMICSGEETIFLYRVHPGEIPSISDMIQCLENNKNGMLELSPAGIRFFRGVVPDGDYYYRYVSDDNWKYEERAGYKNHLFIIGGGHCALALSRLMFEMDFYIHLYEDRPYLNTFLKNTFVHEKNLITNYNQLNDHVLSGEHHYVVIMTFGYRTDDIALRALWDKRFAYLGMLGSAHKIQEMFDAYRAEGVPEEVLQRIYAPVGLPVHSQTPEEIAVSIAAEIIRVKNEPGLRPG